MKGPLEVPTPVRTTTSPARVGPVDSDAFEPVTLGVLEKLAGYHLRRASNAFRTDFSRALAGTGMRQVLLGIMSVIAANPRVNQGLVARVLGIQRANMVVLINELVDRDLIDRRVSPSDRRAFELVTTDLGDELIRVCLKRIGEHEERMLTDLSASERETLIDLLGRIGSQDG